MARASAPGAIIIQFLGGIHEIYFPYVLMKPLLILAVIAGGMTGVATNVLFQSGLRAPASPGSIIAVLIQTASDSYVGRDPVGDPVGDACRSSSRRSSCAPVARSDLAKRTPATCRHGDRADRGQQGQGVERARRTSQAEGVAAGAGLIARGRGAPRSSASRSTRSSSRATPAWARVPWAPRCCATRSRRPASTA